MRLTWKRQLLLVFFGILALSFAMLRCNTVVQKAAEGRCYDQVADIPSAPVALVLGCAPRTGRGNPNSFFTSRIEAATALYNAGKVRALIVSGDNSRKDYDEPTEMKAALVEAGVPADRIYCDYAGLRTLDSVVRAQAIFGQSRFIIVSQRFHNERAIYLALKKNLDPIALNAKDASPMSMRMVGFREKMARMQAMIDISMNTPPKYYGPPVPISLQ